MKKRAPQPAALVATLALSAGVAACAQIVGAGFDGVHPGDPNAPSGFTGVDGSFAQDGAPNGGNPNGGDDGGTGNPIPDGSTPIGDENTSFVDASCGPGATTSISGVVYDPAGASPIYDALVYVPTAPLAPMPTSLTCDRCGSKPSGAPMAIALTGPDGKFSLHGVPAGTDVPLVVQIGKWRRLVHVPTVSPCVDNAITDKNLTRLPKNGSEGDMPRIAVSTGQGDSVECVLLKMGIDASEFTAPGGAGHVHLYQENGAAIGTVTAPDGGTQAWDLYGSLATMQSYDQIVFGCEAQSVTKSATFAQNIATYADQGGRVWFEHYELSWLQAMPGAYATQITFDTSATANPPATNIDVVTSFPKGAALSAWLVAIGATTIPAQFSAPDTRGDILSTTGRSWMSVTSSTTTDAGTVNTALPEAVTFNTPPSSAPSQQCGRVVFSDFHAGELSQTFMTDFPGECSSTALTPEGKAVEFALLDLGACVLPDDVAPTAP